MTGIWQKIKNFWKPSTFLEELLAVGREEREDEAILGSIHLTPKVLLIGKQPKFPTSIDLFTDEELCTFAVWSGIVSQLAIWKVALDKPQPQSFYIKARLIQFMPPSILGYFFVLVFLPPAIAAAIWGRSVSLLSHTQGIIWTILVCIIAATLYWTTTGDSNKELGLEAKSSFRELVETIACDDFVTTNGFLLAWKEGDRAILRNIEQDEESCKSVICLPTVSIPTARLASEEVMIDSNHVCSDQFPVTDGPSIPEPLQDPWVWGTIGRTMSMSNRNFVPFATKKHKFLKWVMSTSTVIDMILYIVLIQIPLTKGTMQCWMYIVWWLSLPSSLILSIFPFCCYFWWETRRDDTIRARHKACEHAVSIWNERLVYPRTGWIIQYKEEPLSASLSWYVKPLFGTVYCEKMIEVSELQSIV